MAGSRRKASRAERGRAAHRDRKPSRRSTLLRFESLEVRRMLAADAGQQLLAQTPPGAVVLPAAVGTAEIHGVKWSDFNGSGERDGAEPGLAGVTIYIDDNRSGTLDPGEATTVTLADNPLTAEDETGAYAFTGLMPGSYIVREVVPEGYDQTSPSGFDIEIVFPDNSLTASQKAVFLQAAARWESIIVADIPAAMLSGVGLVDDVRIEASGPTIDGAGGILGQAGPTAVRSGSSLPIAGVMEFDAADILDLVAEGQFDDVILHEMGHVLGIGTIWEDLDLITGVGTTNARFTGAQATAEYNAIFGVTGTSVPVESDQGGAGTLYGHWDETTFENELMTGFLNPGVANPISRITVAQMADLGYTVDLGAADEYQEPALVASLLASEPAVGRELNMRRPTHVRVGATPAGAASAVAALLATQGKGFWKVDLAEGEIARDVDFGNKPQPASISGRKWNDRDADGVRDADEPGIAGWTIFVDEDGNGQFDQTTNVFVSTDVPGDIDDNQTTESMLTVVGMAQSVTDVNVTLNITHTYDGDLDVALVSPSGRRVVLFSNVGGSGNNFQNTTLDDDAATAITAAAAPFAGTFRPQGQLSLFENEDPNGEWTLEVSDLGNADVGTLNSWSLQIVAGERSTLTDANGDYTFDNLPPGEYRIAEESRADWARTFPVDPGVHVVPVGPGTDVADVDFGSHTGQIGGRLWNDYDGNGVRGPAEPPLAGWTVFLDQNNNGALDDGPRSHAATGLPINVLDVGRITSTITVPSGGVIQDVNVTLSLQHTYDSDLDVFLIGPTGLRIELFSDVGGSSDNFTNTTLDDEATAAITGGAAPFTGSFRPEGLLAALDGSDAAGLWTLEINDDTAADVGQLLSWSLAIATAEPHAVTNAEGAYAFFDLPAGDYTVAQIAPSAYVQTFPLPDGVRHIALGSAQRVTDADFGDRAAAIRGAKFNDKNKNGSRDASEPGLADWLIYLDENANGAFDNGSSTVASTGPIAAIPDLGTLSQQLTVSGLQAIDDINIQFSITHTDVADLDVFLISPAGTRVELFTDIPGGANFNATQLDDEAAGSILAGAAPFAGSFRPETALSAFDGESPNGVWTLEITDDAGNDVGSLKDWSLTIEWHEQFDMTDADGAYEFVNLPAGAYAVHEVNQSGWTPTFPIGDAYALALVAGEQKLSVDFGAYDVALRGDYDADGDVDGNDFLLWQRGLGALAAPPGSGADGDASGSVGAGDLTVWRGSFGSAQAADAAAVTLGPPAPQAFAAADAVFEMAESDASAIAGPWAYSREPRSAATRPRFRPAPRVADAAASMPVAAISQQPSQARLAAMTFGADDDPAHEARLATRLATSAWEL